MPFLILLFIISLIFSLIMWIIDKNSYHYWTEGLVLFSIVITITFSLPLILFYPFRYSTKLVAEDLQSKYEIITIKKESNKIDMKSMEMLKEVYKYNLRAINSKTDIENKWFSIYYDEYSKEIIRSLKVVE